MAALARRLLCLITYLANAVVVTAIGLVRHDHGLLVRVQDHGLLGRMARVGGTPTGDARTGPTGDIRMGRTGTLAFPTLGTPSCLILWEQTAMVFKRSATAPRPIPKARAVLEAFAGPYLPRWTSLEIRTTRAYATPYPFRE